MDEFEAVMGPPYVRNGYVYDNNSHSDTWPIAGVILFFQVCFLWMICVMRQNHGRY